MSKILGRDAIPTIEIVSINKAKEIAAKKCKIPFRYEGEVETYGLFDKNPPRVVVDLKNERRSTVYAYHKLLKKHTKKEFDKIIHPISKAFIFYVPVLAFCSLWSFCLFKCVPENKKAPQPQLIQKNIPANNIKFNERTKN